LVIVIADWAATVSTFGKSAVDQNRTVRHRVYVVVVAARIEIVVAIPVEYNDVRWVDDCACVDPALHVVLSTVCYYYRRDDFCFDL
jgi:hypothetical protein